MRAIMIMYDSLRRDMLPGYNDETPLHMPNFERLAQKTARFETSYVCSLPCMPARRELHTGRPNFLHRSWSPVEPFDDSMPELLKQNGIHTHLSTDHYHYIQDGGATFCGRYSTWDCFRGQESDTWIGDCGERPARFSPELLSPENANPHMQKMRERAGWQNHANRSAVNSEADFPQAHTFENGISFLEKNAAYDGWFLHIETFDPHEPFMSPDHCRERWFDPDEPETPDWPPYAPVTQDAVTVEKMRKRYFALAEYCDEKLGLVLDQMDRLNLWNDTMLIVNTDHGFFLGEHNWWGKGSMPDYDELVHTPLYIWDPRSKIAGETRRALVQTIDLAPTLLDFFDVEIPGDMIGKPLFKTIADDTPVRTYGVFGYHGGPVNITDGRHVYMRGVADHDAPFYEYTHMPTHMNTRFTVDEMRQVTLAPPFSFTKNCPLMRIPARNPRSDKVQGSLLFDLASDPHQESSLRNPALEERFEAALVREMKQNDAPDELYVRYGLPRVDVK